MPSIISSILRKSYKRKYNILTCPTHERFSWSQKDVNATFIMIPGPHIKTWNFKYGPLPKNHILIEKESYIPSDLDIDIIFSQNKFGQFQLLSQYAQRLNVPIVTIEHTLPYPEWNQIQLQQATALKGNINVFITQFNRDAWGDPDGVVINHGIDTELFNPGIEQRNRHILVVANDYINRGNLLGYPIYEKVTQGFPVCPVGDTPGLSKGAENVEELVKHYQTSLVFLNTSTVSPIPMSVLEAMSCGCAVVSTATCDIPNIITTGVNGVCTNDLDEMKYYLGYFLDNPNEAKKTGEQARATILKRYNMSQATSKWNSVFEKAGAL